MRKHLAIALLALAVVSTACVGDQIPAAEAGAETLPPTVATSTTTTTTTLPPTTTSTTTLSATPTTEVESVGRRCSSTDVDELFPFYFIDGASEMGLIHGPAEIADTNRDFVQILVLFAAALCDQYQDDDGTWYLPIYFGDRPDGEKVIGTYFLGSENAGASFSVASSPNNFIDFDPDVKNGLNPGIPDRVPVAEFLDDINRDWLYAVQLTTEDVTGYRPEGCDDDPVCTSILDEFPGYYEYNRSIYEAVAGLGDGPADEISMGLGTVVIYRVFQIGIYSTQQDE